MAIESYYNGQIWKGSGSQTQGTAALGMPIQQYGYQHPTGPYQDGRQNGGGTGSGSGSSGPTNAASQWYEGVMKGDNLPYSPFAVKNLESQATDMNAAAEGARNEQMTGQAAANGASASDPSMQGAKMNSMARRQTDNTRAVNDIQSKANQANFSAQADAAAHMTQMKLAYDEMANSNAMRYSPFGGGGGGGGGGRGRGQSEGGGFAYLPTGNQPPYGGGRGGQQLTQDPYRPSVQSTVNQTNYRQQMADQRHQQYLDQHGVIAPKSGQSSGFWKGPPGQIDPPGSVN